MHQTIAVILASLIACGSHASGLPERITLTQEIQSRDGFEVAATDQHGIIELLIQYPEKIGVNWKVSGTVTWVLKDGDDDNPILSSRTDFGVPDEKRVVLVSIPLMPKRHDLAVDIVYRCISTTGGCKKDTLIHYGIKSARAMIEPEEEKSDLAW